MSQGWPPDPVVHEVADLYLTIALEAFNKISMALDRDDVDTANEELVRYVKQYKDTEENPFEYLTRVGLVQVAVRMRTIAGDPDPAGEPKGELSLSALMIKPDTHEILDRPFEDFVIKMVGYAANWNFAELDREMGDRCDRAMKEGEHDFLPEVSRTLLELYNGLDGSENAGWS